MTAAHLEETKDRPRAKRVLHVWYADYPWDVRVQKVIVGLTRAGWIVDLVARNKANLRPIEMVDGATVHRLPRLRFLKSSVDSVLSFPAFVNPRWIVHIWRVARATKPDVILVRDLPLAPAVVLIARALRIPVAFDMAEDYPGFLRTRWQTNGIKPIDILVRNPWLASLVERWVLRNVDAVVCVIEESAQRVAAMGVPSEKIAIVRNTPLFSGSIERPIRNEVASGTPIVIAYLGLVERHRGVHELVRAIAECRRRNWSVRLVVIGNGSGLSEVNKLASELGILGDGVELLGRVENNRALALLAEADIGAIPHMPCDAWNTTIPNKLFDYMSLGLPVLTSNVVPVRRIVLEEACGVSFTSGDTTALVDAIDQLRSKESRTSMSAAGVKAVRLKYNWSVDAHTLDTALRRVAGRGEVSSILS